MFQGEDFPRPFVQESHHLFDEQLLLNGWGCGFSPKGTKGIQILGGADGFNFGLLGQLPVQPANEGRIEIIVEVSNGTHEPSVGLPGAGECEEGCFEKVGSSRRILLVALGVCVDARPASLGGVYEVLLDRIARLIPWPNPNLRIGFEIPGSHFKTPCNLLNCLTVSE